MIGFMVIDPSEAQKDAYSQGACDYRAGVPLHECPYTGDEQGPGRRLLPFYWHGGWWDEMKRCPRPEDRDKPWLKPAAWTWSPPDA